MPDDTAQTPTSPIVESIREFQAAAREHAASNPPPGCTHLCPGNCAHRRSS
jgi:hypothetical protein